MTAMVKCFNLAALNWLWRKFIFFPLLLTGFVVVHSSV